MAREITAYYGKNAEEARLTKESGQLEIARIQELLRRFLPPAPAAVGRSRASGTPDDGGRALESEPSLLGASGHLLVLSRKQIHS